MVLASSQRRNAHVKSLVAGPQWTTRILFARLPPSSPAWLRYFNKKHSASAFKTNLLRLRNFRDFCQEIGLPATLNLLRQRTKRQDIFELRVKGISTPVYCRA